MKLTITFLLVFTNLSLFSQERRTTSPDIENYTKDLKLNKVNSIEEIQYYYKKSKIDYNKSYKLLENVFDKHGRIVQEVLYRDNTKLSKHKYYYNDTISKYYEKWEIYNENDSLIEVKETIVINGEKIYRMKTKNPSCFGNYKLTYNEKGLISEAIWYGPREGLWANDDMVPIYVVKLKYTFREE